MSWVLSGWVESGWVIEGEVAEAVGTSTMALTESGRGSVSPLKFEQMNFSIVEKETVEFSAAAP